MPWLTGYSATNRIDDGLTVLVRERYDVVPGGWLGYRQETTITDYRYVGMDKATALTCHDDINDPTAHPPVIAQMERQGPGGNYQVSVHEITVGAWEEIV